MKKSLFRFIFIFLLGSVRVAHCMEAQKVQSVCSCPRMHEIEKLKRELHLYSWGSPVSFKRDGEELGQLAYLWQAYEYLERLVHSGLSGELVLQEKESEFNCKVYELVSDAGRYEIGVVRK